MIYDVIIVGARCAGATLAAMLARSGVNVLLLDANKLPSGMPMSTHYIHAPGMAVLDEIGVGDSIRACTPPNLQSRVQMEGINVYADYSPDYCGYCPRRSTLDPLLLGAAEEAGVEWRDQHRVIGLLHDGDRVTGVKVRTPTGESEISAKLVVGADGRNSSVAKFAKAEEYLVAPFHRSAYWFYVPEPDIWQTDPEYDGWGLYLGFRGEENRYIFQTDGGLLLLAASPSREVFESRRRALQRFHHGQWDYRRTARCKATARSHFAGHHRGLCRLLA